MKINILFTIAFMAALSGCGGGGDDSVDLRLTYGSIAINQTNGRAGIAANYDSESAADKSALNQCGDSCVVALRFGPFQCGALARSNSTASFGWSSNNSKTTAEANALSECKKYASDCAVKLSECNG